MVTVLKGNIFNTECQCIVNTINCVGVMGAGIAFECRLRFPSMFSKYIELCSTKKIDIGSLWLYKGGEKWILNFPTKYHWKYPSKIEYLEKGLEKFVNTYKEKEISSIAFPILGASNGGIPEEVSLKIMLKYLEKCDIPIEIYYFDVNAHDDLFLKFKAICFSLPDKTISKLSGLRLDIVRKLKLAIESSSISSMSQLLSIEGVGDVSLEKSFHFIMNYNQNGQQLMFDELI